MNGPRHWFVHAAAADPASGPDHDCYGRRIATCLPPHRTVFQRSFEQIGAELESLPRLFFEPDGSFVWRAATGQLDGQLHDSPEGVATIELKGSLARSDWRRWLACCGWPTQHVVIELAREGVFVTEPTFAELLPDG